MSPKYANALVTLKITSSTITVLDEKLNEIVSHQRLYGDKKQESMEWLPYLRYISRHPHSLVNTDIYNMMPDEIKFYLHGCQVTERGKILKVLAELIDRS